MCAWVVRVCVHLMLWNVCFVTTERRRTETCWWALRCWKLYRFSFLNIPKRLLLSLYCQFAFIFVCGALNVYSNSSRCRAHICSTAQRAFSVNIFGLWRDIDTHKIQSERTNEKLKKKTNESIKMGKRNRDHSYRCGCSQSTAMMILGSMVNHLFDACKLTRKFFEICLLCNARAFECWNTVYNARILYREAKIPFRSRNPSWNASSKQRIKATAHNPS